MEAVIESQDSFKQDIRTLPETEQNRVMSSITELPGAFQEDESAFYASHLNQLENIRVGGEYELSLYALEIENGMNVLLTFDEDPIFEKLHITLYKLVRQNVTDAYLSVAEILTKDLEAEFNNNGERNRGTNQSAS